MELRETMPAEKPGVKEIKVSAKLTDFLNSPSLYTFAGTIVVGAGLYWGTINRLDRIEDRLTAQVARDTSQDVAIKELARNALEAENKTGQQLSTISRDLGDTKTAIRGVEVSIGWIARSITPNGGPPGQPPIKP